MESVNRNFCVARRSGLHELFGAEGRPDQLLAHGVVGVAARRTDDEAARAERQFPEAID